MALGNLRIERHAAMSAFDGRSGRRWATVMQRWHTRCSTPSSSRDACRRETGWQPDHIGVYDDDTLIAALPGYLKTHSYGEYVFDWAWAEALERSGRDYYPKLLCAVPFTPVPGPRLLARDNDARVLLLDAWLSHARSSGVSSAHLLFPDAASLDALQGRSLLLRESVQFHWHNAGYGDFEAFLASLSRDKRKKIRQERRRVSDAGISLRRIEGT
jgi:predicted N-acyltransferase